MSLKRILLISVKGIDLATEIDGVLKRISER